MDHCPKVWSRPPQQGSNAGLRGGEFDAYARTCNNDH